MFNIKDFADGECQRNILIKLYSYFCTFKLEIRLATNSKCCQTPNNEYLASVLTEYWEYSARMWHHNLYIDLFVC